MDLFGMLMASRRGIKYLYHGNEVVDFNGNAVIKVVDDKYVHVGCGGEVEEIDRREHWYYLENSIFGGEIPIGATIIYRCKKCSEEIVAWETAE